MFGLVGRLATDKLAVAVRGLGECLHAGEIMSFDDAEHSSEASGGRALKKKTLALVTREDWPKSLDDLCRLPGSQVVNPLMSFLLHSDENVRWRSVTAIGAVVTNMAQGDMERARVVMRRFMWTLNDESGGIGWGAPESMAEIMARSENLAREYVAVFISYLNPEGNFLEHELLQRGLLWGVVRLAQAKPSLLAGAVQHLGLYLKSGDAVIRGLTAWAVGLLGGEEYRNELTSLLSDDAEVRVYTDKGFEVHRVGELAGKALETL
jgi:hypothetical protein